MRSCETAYGTCKFYGKDEYIGRSLYAYGEWGGEEASVIAGLAKSSGGLCLDVGANIGFMSMAMLHAGCSVVAFEPQPALYELLRENCAGAACSPVALSDSNRTATMPRIRYGDKGNYGGLGLDQRSELGVINVQCVTLDFLGLSPSFIKIDVEGHELAVLRGGVETIKRCKPIMYIEDDRVDKSFELRSFIKSLGYEIKEHRPWLFRENNFKGNKVNIWNAAYQSHNIICTPC